MPKTIEQLETELRTARDDLRAAEKVRDAENLKAAQEVEARFAAALADARQTVWNASTALRDAVDAKARADAESNPLVGRKVWRMQPIPGSWRRDARKRVEGIIEMVTRDTVMSKGKRYGQPSIGELGVRPLKTDGTPGKSIERLNKFRDEYRKFYVEKYGPTEMNFEEHWELIEQQKGG